MAFDPWAGANQGIDSFNNSMLTIAQLKRDDKQQAQRDSLLDLQKQLTQQGIDQNKITLAELGAKKTALIDQYGTAAHTDPYASAVSFQNQQEQDRAAAERKQKGFETYLGTIKALDGMEHLDPKTKTEIGKHFLAQNPEYKPFADNLKYIDSKGVKAARMYKEGELTDPVTKKPLPAGYYETEGRWTGDAANPVELLSYKQAEPPKETADKYQLTEIPSADGKTAQKMRVNMTDGTMTPLGKPYAVKSQVPNVNVTTTGAVPLAQTTFVDSATGQPLVFNKKTGTYSVATVDGATVAPKPSAMSPEAAGKAQMLEQGATYIPTLRAELFDEDGSVNQINVANLTARTWGTRGRELSSLMLDAIEGKLRAESGAAVPEPEVKRAAKRFMPQVGDTAAGIKIKLDNLETYLKGTTQKINNGRGPAKPATAAKPAANTAPKKSTGYADLLNKYRK